MEREMEVEVISRETIKPSSPTPPHLKTFKLSFLDQVTLFTYTPTILLYHPSSISDVDGKENFTRLKESLSETLVHFYPLAGRIKDEISIDCNDEGVEFIEARVNCSMSKILKQPENDLLSQFIHQEYGTLPTFATQVAIQVNTFTCRGIAIGVNFLHKIVDGSTKWAFLNTWASIAAKHCEKVVHPNLGASSLFPPVNLPPASKMPSRMATSMFKKGKPVVKRFVFDVMAIAKLKAKATSACVTNPSRVLVVSGLIWKCSMAASSKVFGLPRASVMRHAVNLRPRTMPPLASNLVGNLFLASITNPTLSDAELHGLVAKMRDAIGKINAEYLETLKGDEGFRVFCESLREMETMFDKEKMDMFNFTSWCNFVKEIDFGWGRPLWVAPVFLKSRGENSTFRNLCTLIETKDGDGIEAFIMLDEKEMTALESDHEFLEFALPNPSVV